MKTPARVLPIVLASPDRRGQRAKGVFVSCAQVAELLLAGGLQEQGAVGCYEEVDDAQEQRCYKEVDATSCATSGATSGARRRCYEEVDAAVLRGGGGVQQDERCYEEMDDAPDGRGRSTSAGASATVLPVLSQTKVVLVDCRFAYEFKGGRRMLMSSR